MAKAAATKVDTYRWEGLDRSGKRVKGELSAESEALAKATLRKQGINAFRH